MCSQLLDCISNQVYHESLAPCGRGAEPRDRQSEDRGAQPFVCGSSLLPNIEVQAMEHDIMQIQVDRPARHVPTSLLSLTRGIHIRWHHLEIQRQFCEQCFPQELNSVEFVFAHHCVPACSGLWFFKDDGKEDGKFLDEYNKACTTGGTCYLDPFLRDRRCKGACPWNSTQVASDMKGMAKVCAINCNECATQSGDVHVVWLPNLCEAAVFRTDLSRYSVFCDKQGVKEHACLCLPVPILTTAYLCYLNPKPQISRNVPKETSLNPVEETPAVMIFPPNPVPAFKLEGKLEGKAGGSSISISIWEFPKNLRYLILGSLEQGSYSLGYYISRFPPSVSIDIHISISISVHPSTI